MAGSKSRRPLRHAIKPIVYEPPTTSSFERSKILAAHNARTDSQSLPAETTRNAGVASSPILAGGRTSGGMKIRGGSFAPKSNVNFI